MIGLSIQGDIRAVRRGLSDFQAKQLPFATSLALNELAKGVRDVESEQIGETFDTPTPFTRNAYRIEVATKSRPIAIVLAKDIQAQYLLPYVVGGPRYLGTKRGMLAPRAVGLNQYGNLTRNKLANLKAKPNVFIGPITFRNGRTVNGVWQRGATPRGTRTKGGGEYGTKGKNTNLVGGVRTTLKLLIQFEDTTPAPKRLPFERRARAYLDRNARPVVETALSRAIATSRR
ncbi:MAG TPA: hypothetical protein VF409_07590 [Sphingomonas sp.]